MNPILIFVGITGPMTLMLLWVIICELRGVRAFPDGPPPEPGQLDALGRWIYGAAWAIVLASAFAVGGIWSSVLFASVIAALATLIALAWTLGQALRSWLGRGVGRAEETESSQRITRRFVQNFRRTIIDVPLFFAAH